MSTEKKDLFVVDEKGEKVNLYQFFNIDPKKVDAVAKGWSIKETKK